MTGVAGLSANLGYNTRSGMKGLSLNCSYGPSFMSNLLQFGGTVVTYNTEPILPKIQVPYKSSYGSFSMDAGPAAGILFAGGGGTGYRSVREVLNRSNSHPAYGTLYAEQGKNIRGSVMDFIREKDNPVIPELPNLALPVNTSDLFSYTSQIGGGQFRLYRGGTGIFFDNEAADVNTNTSLGFDAGFGTYGHGGTTLYKQKTTNVTRKWTGDNLYMKSGDFQDADLVNPLNQHVYFKKTGETTLENASLNGQLHGSEALAVQVNGTTAQNAFTAYPISSPIARHNPAPAQTSISYLSASEARMSGLDPRIRTYALNTLGSFQPVSKPKLANPLTDSIVRDTGYRKGHHISEITVKEESGKRMVYGIPVYQLRQSEYSFAVGPRSVSGLVNGVDQVASPANENAMGQGKGIDNYYHKDSQPAYATSYLLSGVLSPDYVDRTGDGITDDDLGTAIRFNYSRINGFRWRTPYANATLNKALLADADDDKASIVYGEKELWYVHSIMSKTKIAFFITQDRDDALGVSGINGGVNTNVRQKCLREIRLYSRSDMSKPIKVVKFVYNYSLCPNTPNSVAMDGATHGKLTLTGLKFEYANTTKGKYFPYTFTYNTSYGSATNVGYTTASTDRWGTYRPASDIPGLSFLNEEFPYALQEADGGTKGTITSNAGQAASLWHLNHINLPTGGAIDVNYEADDYAYVQDKKAMTMVKVEGIVSAGNVSVADNNLMGATGFKIKIAPTTDNPNATAWFKKNYLNGSDYIYSKCFVKVATSNSTPVTGLESDYIPTYSEVESVAIVSNMAYVYLKKRSEGGAPALNPIIYSAWQRMKDEYPRYAYPGFDRRVGNEGATQTLASAVQAIFTAFANLSELKENFYQKASRLGYANQLSLPKSFVRIAKTDGFKLGGGVRVKRITINDDWNDMGGTSYPKYYGQSYDYTTTEDNKVISSGVASYEPSVGNDENPLKQPVFYIQKIKGALDNFFDLEEPFGESFYPAPSVVYSKVTVTDLSDAGSLDTKPVIVPDPNLQTGYIVNEFYTAKDFPVKVTVLPIQKMQKPPSGKFSLVSTSSVDKLTLSQGYAIELNDMHGKPKAVRVFNQAKSEISSTVYNYNTTDPTAGPLRLRNLVSVINPDGTVSQNQVIGREVEFFTDMREQESVNDGNSLNVGFDIVPAFAIPIPVPHWPSSGNTDYKLFRSACAVKVSQYYGLVSSVVKTVNGSSVTTQNVAYDGQTGEPMLTRTQNEFNKDIFSLNIPAYWAYAAMGPASANQGMVFNLNTNDDGTADSDYSFLKVGDELIDVNGSENNPYWVTGHTFIKNSPISSIQTTLKFIVNKYGEVQPGLRNIRAKIIGSGFKNMLNSGLTSITSLNNPLISNGSGGLKLALGSGDLTSLKVINASANTYSDNWSTQVPDVHVVPSNAPYDLTIYQGNQYATGATQTVMLDQQGPYNSGPVNIYFGLRETNAMIGNSSLYSQNDSNTMGVFAPYYVPADGTYLVGYDSGPKMSFSLDNNCDGNNWFKLFWYSRIPQRNWQVVPVTLTKGWHNFRMELTYSTPNNDNQPNGGAVEIYNNNSGELYNAGMNNGQGLNLIFSTKNLIQNPSAIVYTKNTAGTFYEYKYDDARSTPYSPCIPPPVTINPFLYGFQNNWRPYESMVFQKNRVYNNVLSAANGRLDIASSGYISSFYSHWFFDPTGGKWSRNSTINYGQDWIAANTVTQYDQFGQETENVDALGRFSAAVFDFKGELPAAVVSNARNREVYVNSLEDAAFRPADIMAVSPVKLTEFIQPSTGININALARKQDAHTGNYSVTLPADGLSLLTTVYQYDQPVAPYLNKDSKYQYIKNTDTGVYGIYPNGFEPAWGVLKAKYIFNVWVKDAQPVNRTVNIALGVNGSSSTLTCKAVVEGWKLLEGIIDLNALPGLADGKALTIAITPVAGASVLIDDIRIHPVNGQMKSYAYDDSTFRLMAELDENAFATFYEYDSEGLLVRVKKETERGIMTIKETRSSQKKNTPLL
ncbi:hypothetical protein [Mucilaginibacter sp. Mucisp84]|uniref:hypothetical protein n=1 Tax=Mucilaginibacter sp. Mucisp84 TaxID=3243058 RepID=UPI0039A4C046